MKISRNNLLKTCLFALSIGAAIVVTVSVANNGFNNKSTLGDSSYTLKFDSKNKINSTSDGDVSTSTIKTSSGADLDINYSGVINKESSWQTILPNGYVSNSIDSAINGIKSISFSSTSSLDLYYGWTLNDEDVVYSKAGTIASNTTYTFTDTHPSYFKIVNNSGSSIDVDELNIEYSCEEEAYSMQDLNVLMIGNSFADDTVAFSARIADAYGININLYDAFIASCTIDMHYSNLQSGATSYSMRSMNGSSWDYKDNKSLEEILNFKEWDVITFQQATAVIGLSGSYNNLSNLVTGVRSIVGNHPKFIWYQTWANDNDYMSTTDEFANFNCESDEMFDAIIDCYNNQVAPLGVFDRMIAAGTAVQNLRTSYVGETFTRDAKHMSFVCGRYLLGMNFISSLYNIDLNQSPIRYRPNEITGDFQIVAKEAIMKAQANQKVISECSKINPNLAKYNMDNYTEIDVGLFGGGYWNSTDSSNYNKVIAYDSNSNTYVASKRFTPSTLPVGSLITIGEDFGYRPEAWINDGKQTSRNNEEYKNFIEVDSSFWSGYAYRAFNIFRNNKSELTGHYNDVFDTFRIYVPNDKLGTIQTKSSNPYASQDESLFTSNNMKFENYERLHLDPIAGFYKCDESIFIVNNSLVSSNQGSTQKKFVCTRPFWTNKGELPENTVLIIDSGYQWRSDCWGSYGTSARPNNVTTTFTRLNASFMNNYRVRTFNVSKTNGGEIGDTFIETMNHFRIYVPLSDDVEEEPQQITNGPQSTYVGTAILSTGSTSNIIMALAKDGTASLKFSGTDSGAQTYSYNESTNAISISTTNSISVSVFTLSFGTVTGTYDRNNDQIINVKCLGTISDYVSNNGSITLVKPTIHYNCDGTTSELQNTFKRRYDNGGGWQFDTSNADRFTADSYNAAEGTGGVKVRVLGGKSSYKTGIVLKEELGGLSGLKNLGFWVYNNTGFAFNIRTFFYSSANLTNYTEQTTFTIPSMNSWQYCTTGFTSNSLYNFQLFIQCPTGVSSNFYPTFDGIALW